MRQSTWQLEDFSRAPGTWQTLVLCLPCRRHTGNWIFWEITSWLFLNTAHCLVFSGTCYASAYGPLCGLQIVRSIHASRSCDFTALAGVFNVPALTLQPLVSGSSIGVSRLRVQVCGFLEMTPGFVSAFNTPWFDSGYMFGVSPRGRGDPTGAVLRQGFVPARCGDLGFVAPLRWFEEDLGRCVSFVVVRPMMLGITVGMTRRTVCSDTVAALKSTPAVYAHGWFLLALMHFALCSLLLSTGPWYSQCQPVQKTVELHRCRSSSRPL